VIKNFSNQFVVVVRVYLVVTVRSEPHLGVVMNSEEGYQVAVSVELEDVVGNDFCARFGERLGTGE
jgi:hypothetical protein